MEGPTRAIYAHESLASPAQWSQHIMYHVFPSMHVGSTNKRARGFGQTNYASTKLFYHYGFNIQHACMPILNPNFNKKENDDTPWIDRKIMRIFLDYDNIKCN